jgi:hypothetical protein
VVSLEPTVEQDTVSILNNDVVEFLVESDWRQQHDLQSMAAIDELIVGLRVDRELRSEHLAADGTLDTIVAEVLLESREYLLLSQAFIALRALAIDFEVKGVFEDVAESGEIGLTSRLGLLSGILVGVSSVEHVSEVDGLFSKEVFGGSAVVEVRPLAHAGD